MTFETETGSVYEIDPDGNRVRRLYGRKGPTTRQGHDESWKEFKFFAVTLDGNLWFDWDGEGHGTMSSRVVRQIEEE